MFQTIHVHVPGGTEVLKPETVEVGEPAAGEIRIAHRAKGGISVRFPQSQRLSGGVPDPADRAAGRCQVRLRSSAARRDLQGNGQHVAVQLVARHQEQAGVLGARDAALHTPPQHHEIPPEPVLSRQHVDADARRRRGPDFRAACHHMWEEPKTMDDVEVFRTGLKASGLDIDRLIAHAQQDDVKKRLIELINDAVVRGASGSRTFLSARGCSSAKISCATSRSRSLSRRASWRRRAEPKTSASCRQA
jgi:hypothetical protein